MPLCWHFLLSQMGHHYAYTPPSLVPSVSRNVHALSAARTESLPSVQRRSIWYVFYRRTNVFGSESFAHATAQQWAEVVIENLSSLSRAIIKGRKTEQAGD